MTQESKKTTGLPGDATLIDSHCHLDMEVYGQDLEEVLWRARTGGVRQIITIGIDLPSSTRAVQLALKYPFVYATVGIHPHDVEAIDDGTLDSIAELARHHRSRVIGYGEIGLDYVKKYSAPDIQRTFFARQLCLARDLELPVVIHDREAHDDTLRLLKDNGLPAQGGVMHCYSGDMAFAGRLLDLGLYISIPGVVTFKNATTMQEVAKNIPLDRLLVETDGPFLSPHPHRGKRNEPAYTLHTAAKIAELRGISLEELACRTTENCRALFNIAEPTEPKG